MIIVIVVKVGIDGKFTQMGIFALCGIRPRATKQVPHVDISALLPAVLNLKFVTPE